MQCLLKIALRGWGDNIAVLVVVPNIQATCKYRERDRDLENKQKWSEATSRERERKV